MREKNNEQLLLCAGDGVCCSVFVEGSRLRLLVALSPLHSSRDPWPLAGWVKSKPCSPLDVEGVVQREAEVRPG